MIAQPSGDAGGGGLRWLWRRGQVNIAQLVEAEKGCENNYHWGGGKVRQSQIIHRVACAAAP